VEVVSRPVIKKILKKKIDYYRADREG
jgi:hypothetical protein